MSAPEIASVPTDLPTCDAAHHCVTCADEGVAMRVLRADAARALAVCADPDGAETEVQLDLVGDVAVGDSVLVHAGVALTRLDGGEVPA